MIGEDKRRLVDENTHLRQELRQRYDFSNIVGGSGPMRQMYELVAHAGDEHDGADSRGVNTGKEQQRTAVSGVNTAEPCR